MNAVGFVVSLHIAPAGAAVMQTLNRGTSRRRPRSRRRSLFRRNWNLFQCIPASGREVTLIESEAIEALKRDYGVEIAAALARRNLVTRGVALNHLIERQFTVGAVTLRGTRLCDPCAHLEKLSRKGALRGLIHRGGLRAEIITGGVIRIGDTITPVGD